jgi:hypothetical protein
MTELANRACFLDKALGEAFIVRQVRTKYLNRTILAEGPMDGAIDHAHAAATQPLDKLVRSKDTSDETVLHAA